MPIGGKDAFLSKVTFRQESKWYSKTKQELKDMKTTKLITPCFKDGEFAGVRVCIGDEDFVIAPRDYHYGKAMTWPNAMDALKNDGLSTFNYRQICLTMAYRKEIDKMLEDNGGDKLNKCWIREEYVHPYAFLYQGVPGFLDASHMSYLWSVRPIKNLKEE